MKRVFLFAMMLPAAVLFSESAVAADSNPICGKASWYAMTTRTASGQRASPNTMTAAHRTLPFGTRVRVTNLRNGRSTVVRINDRGPFVKGRIIDVTQAVASRLGFMGQGWTRVGISTIGARYQRGRGCKIVGATASLQPLKVPLPKARPLYAKGPDADASGPVSDTLE